ncbi:uncharacterized protein [Musca autumnalis]|uniref:uncharacterized protein n=1 Tax=Musca autumnalis TaxID=221902 RepID=UPI003CF5E81B
MDLNVPEIALKQPKADPRTVLLRKRNCLNSLKDTHMTQQEQRSHYKMSLKSRKMTQTQCLECDRLMMHPEKHQHHSHSHHHHHHQQQKQQQQMFPHNSSQISSLTQSRPVLSICSTPSTIESQIANTNATTTTSHSKILVNLYESCHLTNIFSLCFLNDCLQNLYKFQKTKLLLILLVIYCAITSSHLLPTTQAIPIRHTTTSSASGQRLILHSNVYRERYHQNLLQEQRQHQNQQQQILQKFHQYHHLQQQQQKSSQHRYSSQHLQQQQFQRPSSYLAPILRKVHRHHHQLQQHHHLHQRAAPTATTTTVGNILSDHKMNICENDPNFGPLYKQINVSLQFIKGLCSNYLRHRGNTTLDEMKETWKLLKLEIRNPTRKEVKFDKELHQEMHDFFLNLHNFQQLVEFALQYNNENRRSIEHNEDINIKIILELFENLKTQINHSMHEAEHVLRNMNIEKPDLNANTVEFNRTHAPKLRDFLIIKEFMEYVEDVKKILENFCQVNGNDEEP